MKKTKKMLSVLLAVLIAMSGMMAGFSAFAADAKDKSTALQEAEAAIDAFMGSHKNNLYQKDEEKKKAAREALDEAVKATKKLSDSEREEMDKAKLTQLSNYASQIVANSEKSPSTNEKIAVVTDDEKMKELEDYMGALPKAYKEAIEAFAPYTTKFSNNKYLSNTEFASYDKATDTYTENKEATAELDKLIENFKGLSLDAVEYAGALYPTTGGFYIYQTGDLDETKFVENIQKHILDKVYDLNIPEGKAPSTSFDYKAYAKQEGKYPNYTYSWVEGKSAQDYVDDSAKWLKDVIEGQMIASNLKAFDEVCAIFDASVAFKNSGSLYKEVAMFGVDILEDGKADLATARELAKKVNEATGTVKAGIDALKNTMVYVTYTVRNEYKDASALTPQTAYKDYTRASGVYSQNAFSETLGYPQRALVPEFEAMVNAMSVDKTTYAELAEAKAMFVEIGSYQKNINADVMTKFKELVAKIKNPYDYSKELKEFKQTEFVRPETESNIAWTTGGIQSAVDGMWKTVQDLGPILGIDLSNGISFLLEDNLYKVDIVKAVLGLYATLESNPDIGGYLGLLGISASNLKKGFVEDKFAGAVEKMAAADSFADIAAIEFEAKDFGFTDGDRDGFVDAVLASLRPITAILAKGSFGIKYFVDDDLNSGTGERVVGIYGNLIPVLEQLGMNVPSVDALKANYDKVLQDNEEAYGKNASYIAYDETLRPILNALFKDVVDPICADPLNGLIEVLPRLAYVLDSKTLDTAVRNILSSETLGSIVGGIVGGIEIPTIDGEFINGLLKAPIDLSSLVGMEAGSVTIKLDPIDWKALANCATVERIDSVTATNMYAILRTGETDSCFSTLFYYIYDVLFANDSNYASLKTLLNNLGLPSFIMGTVISALDGLKSVGKVAAYGQLLDMFGKPTGDVIEKPVDPEDPDKPTDPQDPDVPTDPETPDGDDGDKLPVIPGADDEDTDSPTIPDTGAAENVVTAFAVLVAVSVALATAIFFVMRKKGLID